MCVYPLLSTKCLKQHVNHIKVHTIIIIEPRGKSTKLSDKIDIFHLSFLATKGKNKAAQLYNSHFKKGEKKRLLKNRNQKILYRAEDS